MKAVVFYADRGLVVEDVPMPDLLPDQVRVKMANTGFCGSDHSMIENKDIREGTILGHEVSGTVVATGSDVTGVEEGLRVIIRPTFCGKCRDCLMGKPYFCQENRRLIGIQDLPGGFAEYITVYPQMLIPVPDGVDSRNAALVEAFAASLHGIECSAKEGGSALVIGAGPIGIALVGLLKLKGFGPIMVSEPVAEKRALAKTFGADEAVDPFTENLGLCAYACTREVGFETVFECSGIPGNVQAGIDASARGATVCIVSVMFRDMTLSPITLTFKEILLTASYSNTHEENRQVLDWMARGKLDARPLITDLISLDDLPKVYADRIHTGKAVKVMLQIGEEF